MKILLLATIATLTTLDLRVLSYEQYCLRDYQVDNGDGTTQPPPETAGVPTDDEGPEWMFWMTPPNFPSDGWFDGHDEGFYDDSFRWA